MNIALYTAGGFHWLGLKLHDGRVVLITKLGRVGDCISLGAR